MNKRYTTETRVYRQPDIDAARAKAAQEALRLRILRRNRLHDRIVWGAILAAGFAVVATLAAMA